MAPPWVLLDRVVWFQSVSAAKPDDHRPKKRAKTYEEWEAAFPDDMEAVKPEALAPPEITRLSMLNIRDQLLHTPIHIGRISSTDKSLVALYTGNYQPGNPSSRGYYLVYDASDGSLSGIPPLPDHRCSFSGLGRGAAILSLGGNKGSYVLAELVASRSELPKADLFLWRSSASPNQQARRWVRRSLRLPYHVLDWDKYPAFRIDRTFSYAGSSVCWVDLFSGAIICDLLAPEPRLTFVALPAGCSVDFPIRMRPARPHEFRTMGCVRGAIRFAILDGFYESTPENEGEIVLRTWTLSPDLKEWREDGAALRVRDLWESESFRDAGLPRLAPMTPVLSVDEDDVVCFAMADCERVQKSDDWGASLVGARAQSLLHVSCRHGAEQSLVLHHEHLQDIILAPTACKRAQRTIRYYCMCDHLYMSIVSYGVEQQKTDTEGSKHARCSPGLKTKLKKQRLIIKRAHKVSLRNVVPWGMKRPWRYCHWINTLTRSRRGKRATM
ncbi:hypothetical protein EJB05_53844, partial [Eragrostis curvula]